MSSYKYSKIMSLDGTVLLILCFALALLAVSGLFVVYRYLFGSSSVVVVYLFS